MSDVDALMQRYHRRQDRNTHLKTGVFGVIQDIMMFRRMVTPWIIRGGFILAVIGFGLVVVLWMLQTLGGPGGGIAPAPLPLPWGITPVRVSPAADLIGGVVALLVIRVMCEAMIVVFQINESLTDLRGVAVRRQDDQQ